ncbi:hypothetical protein GC177_00800 [bacterium]|nr:hypothetical protein [bacterium]
MRAKLAVPSGRTADYEAWWDDYKNYIYAKDLEGWKRLWHPQSTVKTGYVMPGVPQVISGTEHIRQYMDQLIRNVDRTEYFDDQWHQTVTPNVGFVEHGVSVIKDGHEIYRNHVIKRMTFKDGLLFEMVAYYDTLAHMDYMRRIGATTFKFG